jgi:FkbM family methyltransferase
MKTRRHTLFTQKFGWRKGLLLTLQFKLKQLEDLKIPGIVHPISLRYNTSDISTFNHIFIFDHYKVDLKAPEVIIDGGANTGLFAVYMKNKYPGAKIICIEPDPENFEMLQKNVQGYAGIECIRAGIWNKDTNLKVYDKYNMGKWAMVVEEDEVNGTVPAITIQSIMERFGIEKIDLLKLDIETSEKQVFQSEKLDWLASVHHLVIELHDWMEKGCSRPFFEAINRTFSSYEYGVLAGNTHVVNNDIT